MDYKPVMNKNALLKMTGICKSFPGVKALDNASLTVHQSEVHALLGENGAGKSTLLKILAGAYSEDSGSIEINGKKVSNLTPQKARDLGISIIYQEFSTLPYLSIAENLFLGRLPQKRSGLVDWKICRERTSLLLAQVGLDISPLTLVSRLAVAQQQLVEIAKAISYDAKIIIMDEPTAPLTQREIDHLFEIIGGLKAKGAGIVYVSHRLAEIQQICDVVTTLRDGCNVGGGIVSQFTIDDLIRMMVGRDLSVMYPKSNAPIGDPVLQVRNLCIENRLYNISMQVRKGEILGIAGLVGAGRTEFARSVFGADSCDSGEIEMNGVILHLDSPAVAIKNKIGLIPEDRKGQGLVLLMNVKDNISLACLSSFSRAGKLNISKEVSASQDYVKKMGIATPDIFTATNSLSGGNQQKVVLSKWLCADCRLLIMDEPTRGIDVGSKVEIYELMNSLVHSGMAIIMISSELPELIGMCDRILVMHSGTIAGELEREEFTEEAIMRLATGSNCEEKVVND
jgi:ribose transport system ATP-binding protein